MATFKQIDRAKRKAWKAYHAAALRYAEETHIFSELEDGLQRLDEAWYAYRFQMQSLGGFPVTRAQFEKDFSKR